MDVAVTGNNSVTPDRHGSIPESCNFLLIIGKCCKFEKKYSSFFYNEYVLTDCLSTIVCRMLQKFGLMEDDVNEKNNCTIKMTLRSTVRIGNTFLVFTTRRRIGEKLATFNGLFLFQCAFP